MHRTLGPLRNGAYAREVPASVEVHLFAAAKAAIGVPMVTADAGLLGAILDDVGRRYPAFVEVRPRCSYLVDGLASRPDVVVPPGGRVDVLPPFAGG
jgi:molybdopterin synthase sulfur carrier subunit